MRNDASFSNEIECTEPHELELYNVVELEPGLTAKVKDYADLLDQKSPLFRTIRDQVNERCPAGSAYDVTQRGAGGLPVQLGPTLNTSGGVHMAWDPFPADLWAKGQRKFVCTFEQDEPGTLQVHRPRHEQGAGDCAGLPEDLRAGSSPVPASTTPRTSPRCS